MADSTDYTAYPDGAALRAFLASAGVVPVNIDDQSDAANLADMDRYAAAAAKRWEKATDWAPFLASGTASTRRIRKECSGRYWDLPTGIVPGTITAVTLYALRNDTTGQALTYDDHYTFYPYDAESQQRPYEMVDMAYGRGCGILSITALWGYCAVLPADVYEAILSDAAAALFDTLKPASGEGGEGGAISEIRRSELTVKFATSAEERCALVNGWKSKYQTAVNQYRRVIIC